ncbi:MAG: hypothetical protein K0S39_4398 [Paenibacillus sp.]|nr:hypothetical protein [Paenibacillus sp.]
MKLIWKTGVFLFLLWLIAFLVYQGRVVLNQIEVVKNTAAFLKTVQSQNFDKSAELYGGSINLEKMRKLHVEEGFRLLSYDRIIAEYDDGCVCSGHADLTFEVDGKPLSVSAIVTVSQGNKPGQICAITPLGTEKGSIPVLSEWNLIACGNGSF